MNIKCGKAFSLVTILATGAYLVATLWLGRREVREAFNLVSSESIFAVLGLSLTNYGLRFIRWHYYLRKLGGAIPIVHDLRIYIGGFALTTTPGKAGELARTLWLRPYGVPANMSVAVFVAERIQDLISILLLSCLGLLLFPNGQLEMAIGVALVLAGLVILFGSSGLSVGKNGLSIKRRGLFS